MENSCRQHVNLYEKTQTRMMLSNLHANFSFVRRRMPHEECLILGFFENISLFSVGRRATVNMEQSAQENKSIIMTITMVRGSL